MNLSTVDRVLALTSATGKATDETRAEVAAVLATVSGAVERYLDRFALRQARTEYHDVEPMQSRVRLRAYPVTTLTSVNYDPDQAFGSTTAMTSSDYYDPTLDVEGALVFRYPFMPSVPHSRALKVVYTGGMATDTDSFVAAYPDLAGAVDVQTSHEWQRRNALGVSSVSYPDGTTASLSLERWVASVKQVLDYYRRVSIG